MNDVTRLGVDINGQTTAPEELSHPQTRANHTAVLDGPNLQLSEQLISLLPLLHVHVASTSELFFRRRPLTDFSSMGCHGTSTLRVTTDRR